jgi:hypothetical protein
MIKQINLLFILIAITINIYSQKVDSLKHPSHLSGNKVIYTDSVVMHGVVIYTDSLKMIDKFTSTNYEKTQRWAHQQMEKGYKVDINYNKKTKEYIAVVLRNHYN